MKSSPSRTVPETTLKYETSPICGSTVVLKKNKLVGPFASGATSSPSEVIKFGILSTQGTILPKNSNVRRTHISFSAETQKTGNISLLSNPLRIPSLISSSLKKPSSKNFSIKASSFSAADSTNA